MKVMEGAEGAQVCYGKRQKVVQILLLWAFYKTNDSQLSSLL